MERAKTRGVLLVVLVAYVVLMAAFTFLDYPIAQAAYHPGTPYAKLFETVATIPMPIMGIFATISF